MIDRAMAVGTQWESFFVASAGAMAALSGLIFVSVSINLDHILRVPGLDQRAMEALSLLVGSLLLALLVLVPSQPVAAWVAEAGGFALLAAYLAGRSTRSMWPVRRAYPRTFAIRVAQALVTVPLFVVVAIVGAFSAGGRGSLPWLAAAVITSTISASISAWVLLVEINRDRPTQIAT